MTDKLYILTEERPKVSVLNTIVDTYVRDFGGVIEHFYPNQISIKPLFNNGLFSFSYSFEGIKLRNIEKIFIKTVSGTSSFFDFLVFKQENSPEETIPGNLLMAIEETKTNDSESRNTAVGQRSSKFVYIDAFYQNVKKYMLYNDELDADEDKRPPDTAILGTNCLLTLGVSILGKDITRWYRKFNSIDDLIEFKSSMRRPPASNTPIDITRYEDRIEISGRLDKPRNEGKIAHDPNIGTLSILAKVIRHLGWSGRIVITRHNVTQEYVTGTRGKNKFLYICNMLGMELDGIVMPRQASLPDTYWHYEKRSEKMASILTHIVAENYGMRGIYQNHAGCERGYFIKRNGDLIALPKRDSSGEQLYIPDLVLEDPADSLIYNLEGKKLSTLAAGLEEIKNYDSIEFEYIKPSYPGDRIIRYLTIFGGNKTTLPDPKVIVYLNEHGRVIVNPSAPDNFKAAFTNAGASIE